MPSLERFFNPQMRVFDLNIRSLPGARLYFFAAGSTTPKATFTTKAGGTPNANPVIADSSGTFPPIFLDGLYRVELRSAQNIVQSGWPIDNVGQDNPIVPFGPYSEIVTYNEGEIVTGSNGNWYRSVGDNNLGSDPISSPGEWEVIPIPVASTFTSNADYFTWSDDGDQISLDVDGQELADSLVPLIYQTNPKVSTSLRTAAIDKVTNVTSIDPDLSISALSAGWYEVEVYMHFTTEGSSVNGIYAEIVKTNGDAFGFPATAGVWDHVESGITTADSYNKYLGTSVLVYPGTSSNNSLKFKGMVNNSAGTGICITWAQGTLTPSNATRVQCGYIKVTRLLDL